MFCYFVADLIKYCVKENVPFTVFEDWSTILNKVKQIVAGEISVQDAAKEGYEQYKRGEAGVESNGQAK
jgi:2-hydroxy-3-keto-5-methylthiopentenyl-1-phosphate phosphatase